MLSPLAQGSDVQSMLVQCSFAGPVSSEDSNILLLLLPRYVGSTAGFPRGAVSYLTGERYVVSTLVPPRRWSDPKSRRTVHFLLPDMLSPHYAPSALVHGSAVQCSFAGPGSAGPVISEDSDMLPPLQVH